jgi:hypothetical protein
MDGGEREPAFPNQAEAKPRESNTTTEITKFIVVLYNILIVNVTKPRNEFYSLSLSTAVLASRSERPSAALCGPCCEEWSQCPADTASCLNYQGVLATLCLLLQVATIME